MTKVYTLTTGMYEDMRIVDVFDTEEAAKAYIVKHSVYEPWIEACNLFTMEDVNNEHIQS